MNNDDLEVSSQDSNVMNTDMEEEIHPMPKGSNWRWVPGHFEGGAWIAGYWEED